MKTTPLIKTEDRLSRNLDDQDFTGEINDYICRLGSRSVLDDMTIAIDPRDIRKRYAPKMGCLAKIHDGSVHEVGDGHRPAKAVAADIEHKKALPLYLEAYSQESKEYKSENDQLFKVIDTIGACVGASGYTRSTAAETGVSSTTSSWRRGRKRDLSSVLPKAETSSTKE